MPSTSARATAASRGGAPPPAAVPAGGSVGESLSRLWGDLSDSMPDVSGAFGAQKRRSAAPALSTPRALADSVRSSWSGLLASAGLAPRADADARGAAAKAGTPTARQAAAYRELHRELAESRARALAQEALLDGWARFTRDLLFAALLSRREENFRAALADSLSARALEVDGIRSLEVSSVTLPSDASQAPSLALLKHEAEGVTRWALEWRPAALHCSAVVRVDGSAPFGRPFSVECALSEVKLSGTLRVAIQRARGDRGELDISFVSLPTIDFKVAVVGSWMGARRARGRREAARRVPSLRGATGVDSERASPPQPSPACAFPPPSAARPAGAPLKPLLAHLLLKLIERSVVEPRRLTRPIPGPAPLSRQAGGSAAAGAEAGAEEVAAPLHSDAELAAAADPRLLAVLAQQRADGAWPLDSRLAAALGAPLSALQAAMPAELDDRLLEEGTEPDAPPARAWASALVLAVLRLRYHDAIHAWQPRAALAEQLPGSLQRAAMEAAIALGIDQDEAVADDGVLSRRPP